MEKCGNCIDRVYSKLSQADCSVGNFGSNEIIGISVSIDIICFFLWFCSYSSKLPLYSLWWSLRFELFELTLSAKCATHWFFGNIRSGTWDVCYLNINKRVFFHCVFQTEQVLALLLHLESLKKKLVHYLHNQQSNQLKVLSNYSYIH